MMEFTSPLGLAISVIRPLVKDSDLAEPDWSDDPELDEAEIAAYREITFDEDTEESATTDDD